MHALHAERGARFVPFAGYEMPVQYRLGVLKEHLHTRAAAGLFDVSHMGQLMLAGPGCAAQMEALVPVDVVDLAVRQQRYALFTHADGGILDDLMITRLQAQPGQSEAAQDLLFVVVNAACKEQDTAHLTKNLQGCTVTPLSEHALLALQGPAAAAVMARLAPAVDFGSWTFMTACTIEFAAGPGAECLVTRSGYSGEDGFEISIPNAAADALARKLLDQPEVELVGLGARDSLRLEAGLCLYGHDIDVHTTPVEAGLTWAISKARRPGGVRAGGFPGSERILGQIERGVERKRVGLIGVERTPVREGAELVDAAGASIGRVTSGGFGPSCPAPMSGSIAMGYVAAPHAALGSTIFALVRGRRVEMRVARMPFVPARYYRI